jgi:hypothetical protein
MPVYIPRRGKSREKSSRASSTADLADLQDSGNPDPKIHAIR